jgi:hypothetical protein
MSRVERGKTAAFLLQLEHRISVLLFARVSNTMHISKKNHC